MPRTAAKNRPGPTKQFDTELRVYVTQEQFDAVADEAVREQRLVSNMVRVLLGEALNARYTEAEMKRAGESSA